MTGRGFHDGQDRSARKAGHDGRHDRAASFPHGPPTTAVPPAPGSAVLPSGLWDGLCSCPLPIGSCLIAPASATHPSELAPQTPEIGEGLSRGGGPQGLRTLVVMPVQSAVLSLGLQQKVTLHGSAQAQAPRATTKGAFLLSFLTAKMTPNPDNT